MAWLPTSASSDTIPAVIARENQTLRALPPGIRFLRAMELTAYVRALAWQGAILHAGVRGNDAVTARFLEQILPAETLAQRTRLLRRSAVG